MERLGFDFIQSIHARSKFVEKISQSSLAIIEVLKGREESRKHQSESIWGDLGKGSKYKKKSVNFLTPRLGGGGSEVIFDTFQLVF